MSPQTPVLRRMVTAFADAHTFWAPSVIRLEDRYYMYVSCITAAGFQFMHVASADSPLGPFKNEKCLYPRFSIDSHMVKTEAGLFLWYAEDNTRCELKGTRVFVDRFVDPYTPEHNPKEVLLPEFEEEKYPPPPLHAKGELVYPGGPLLVQGRRVAVPDVQRGLLPG